MQVYFDISLPELGLVVVLAPMLVPKTLLLQSLMTSYVKSPLIRTLPSFPVPVLAAFTLR
jgi:hypothetical protein